MIFFIQIIFAYASYLVLAVNRQVDSLSSYDCSAVETCRCNDFVHARSTKVEVVDIHRYGNAVFLGYFIGRGGLIELFALLVRHFFTREVFCQEQRLTFDVVAIAIWVVGRRSVYATPSHHALGRAVYAIVRDTNGWRTVEQLDFQIVAVASVVVIIRITCALVVVSVSATVVFTCIGTLIRNVGARCRIGVSFEYVNLTLILLGYLIAVFVKRFIYRLVVVVTKYIQVGKRAVHYVDTRSHLVEYRQWQQSCKQPSYLEVECVEDCIGKQRCRPTVTDAVDYVLKQRQQDLLQAYPSMLRINSIPVDRLEIIGSEHRRARSCVSRHFYEVYYGIPTEYACHHLVEQPVDGVWVKGDIDVEESGISEIYVDTAAKQLYNVKLSKGFVHSAWLLWWFCSSATFGAAAFGASARSTAFGASARTSAVVVRVDRGKEVINGRRKHIDKV